jgi:hypothetical protein
MLITCIPLLITTQRCRQQLWPACPIRHPITHVAWHNKSVLLQQRGVALFAVVGIAGQARGGAACAHGTVCIAFNIRLCDGVFVWAADALVPNMHKQRHMCAGLCGHVGRCVRCVSRARGGRQQVCHCRGTGCVVCLTPAWHKRMQAPPVRLRPLYNPTNARFNQLSRVSVSRLPDRESQQL